MREFRISKPPLQGSFQKDVGKGNYIKKKIGIKQQFRQRLKKRSGATLVSMSEYKNKKRLYKMTKGSAYRT